MLSVRRGQGHVRRPKRFDGSKGLQPRGRVGKRHHTEDAPDINDVAGKDRFVLWHPHKTIARGMCSGDMPNFNPAFADFKNMLGGESDIGIDGFRARQPSSTSWESIVICNELRSV